MQNNDPTHKVKKILESLAVKEVMTSPVQTLHVDALFSRVEELFLRYNVRHLPIVDDDQAVLGIITQKDLYKLISPRRVIEKTLAVNRDTILDGDAFYSKEVLDTYILEYVMTKEVCTLSPKSSVGDAIDAIVSNAISSVLIVDEQRKAIGIITTHDILQLMNKMIRGVAS